MSKLYTGNTVFGDSFNIRVSAPIDDRMVVGTFNDLIDNYLYADDKVPYYEGMSVYVADEKQNYILTANAGELDNIVFDDNPDEKLKSYWKKSVDLSDYSTSAEIASKYQLKGQELDLSDYLKVEDASNNYLLKTDADSKYQSIGNYALKSDIVTKTSQLVNDSDFISKSSLKSYATEKWVEDKGYLTEVKFGSLSDDSNDAVYGAVEATALDAIINKIENEIPTKTSQLINDAGFITDASGSTINPNEILVCSNVESAYRTITYKVAVSDIVMNETSDGSSYINGYYSGFSDNQKITGKIMSMTFTGKENTTIGAMISINVPSDYNVKILYYDSINLMWNEYSFIESVNENRKSYVRNGVTLTGPIDLKVVIYK